MRPLPHCGAASGVHADGARRNRVVDTESSRSKDPCSQRVGCCPPLLGACHEDHRVMNTMVVVICRCMCVCVVLCTGNWRVSRHGGSTATGVCCALVRYQTKPNQTKPNQTKQTPQDALCLLSQVGETGAGGGDAGELAAAPPARRPHVRRPSLVAALRPVALRTPLAVSQPPGGTAGAAPSHWSPDGILALTGFDAANVSPHRCVRARACVCVCVLCVAVGAVLLGFWLTSVWCYPPRHVFSLFSLASPWH